MTSIQTRRPDDATDEPKIVVSTKSALTGSWKDHPYLYARTATQPLGPRIGTATLLWRYGKIEQNDKTSWKTEKPKDLAGQYVRIQVVGSGGRRTKWMGVITDATYVLQPPVDGKPTGDQVWTAREFSYFLDRRSLDKAMAWAMTDSGGWDDPDTAEYDIAELGWFPSFNTRDPKGTGIIGNRSAEKASEIEADSPNPECYVFGGTDIWTHEQAVEYILAYHMPEDWDVLLTGQHEILGNMRSVYHAEGVKPWRALEHLIDKSKGVAFRLVAAGDEKFNLRICSALSEAYSLGAGAAATTRIVWHHATQQLLVQTVDAATTDDVIIPANSEQLTLDLDDEDDYAGANVSILGVTQYDKVEVIGGRAVVCFTLSWEDGTLVPGWDKDQEIAYMAGAGDGTDAEANDLERISEKFVNVYRRFTIPPDGDWKWKARNGKPILKSYKEADGQMHAEYTPGISHGKGFLRVLPIMDPETVGTDKPGPMSPIAFAKEAGKEAESDTWVSLDGYDNVGATVRMIDGELSVFVRWGTQNHRLARNYFNPPAWDEGTTYSKGQRSLQEDTLYTSLVDNNTGNDPSSSEDWEEFGDQPAPTELDDTWGNTVDPTHLMVTVALETDERLRVAAAKTEGTVGETEKVLTIHVEDADVAYVVPGTVRDVVEGSLMEDTGFVVRNNAKYLYAIAHQALAWYGTQRTALTVRWNTVERDIPLGAMVTSIGTGWLQEDVNSLITEKRWDFELRKFSISTGYARFGPGQGGVNFPGLSGPREVAHEIRRMRGEIGEIAKRTINIPSRFGGGGGGGSGSGEFGDPRDWGDIVWINQGET